MEKKIDFRLVEDAPYAYLVCHKDTYQVLGGNKMARYIYKEQEFPIVLHYFLDFDFEMIRQQAAKELKENGCVLLKDLVSIKNTGQQFLCDVEIRYYDYLNKLIYLVIKSKEEERTFGMKDWVEGAQQPFLVLGQSADLPIIYGNNSFYQHFSMTEEELFHVYGGSLVSLSPEHKRNELVMKVLCALEEHDNCDIVIELHNAMGELLTFRFTAHKINPLDPKSQICGMLLPETPRETQVGQFKGKLELMQGFSEGALFCVDLESYTWSISEKVEKLLGVNDKTHSFIHGCTLLVHPDDLEKWSEFVELALEKVNADALVRFDLPHKGFSMVHVMARTLSATHHSYGFVLGMMEEVAEDFKIPESPTVYI